MGRAKRISDASDGSDAGNVQGAILDTGEHDGGTDIPVIDPADSAGELEASGEQPKKRGRKPGSKNKPKPQISQNLGIEKTLLAIHTMGAAYFKIPELMLTPKEAEAVSEAIEDVAQYYPIGLNPVYVAWGNLAMVLFGTYGTRLGAYRVRMAAQRAAESQQAMMQPSAGPNGAVNIDSFVRV